MKNNCPECGNSTIIKIDSELICKDCGLVIEECLFGEELPQTFAEEPQLATAGTRPVSGKIFKQEWLYSTREKNLRHAYIKIEVIGSMLKIPKNTLTEATIIYKQAVNKGLPIGRDIISIIYASIYTACIIHGLPKIPREMVRQKEITKTQLLKAHKLIKKRLGITAQPINPLDLVHRFGTRLKLKQETISKATEIIMKLDEKYITGKKPETITAVALYISAKQNNEEITQRKTADMLGIIEVTLRKRVKEIEHCKV